MLAERLVDGLRHRGDRGGREGAVARRAGQGRRQAARRAGGARRAGATAGARGDGLPAGPRRLARLRRAHPQGLRRSGGGASVRDNPYRLARDVPGIGFIVADRIAQGMGIGRDSPLRIQAGVLHVLESLTDDGHVFFPAGELAARAAEALQIDAARAAEAVAGARRATAARSSRATRSIRRGSTAPRSSWRGASASSLDAERAAPPPIVGAEQLSDGQRRAIAQLRRGRRRRHHRRPGHRQDHRGARARADLGAGAPARAAGRADGPRRQAAVGGDRAHGADGASPARVGPAAEARARAGRAAPFGRGDDNPLPTDLLVVDEASMLDVLLARGLVAAVRAGRDAGAGRRRRSAPVGGRRARCCATSSTPGACRWRA